MSGPKVFRIVPLDEARHSWQTWLVQAQSRLEYWVITCQRIGALSDWEEKDQRTRLARIRELVETDNFDGIIAEVGRLGAAAIAAQIWCPDFIAQLYQKRDLKAPRVIGLWKAVQQHCKLTPTLACDQSLKTLAVGLNENCVAKDVRGHELFLSPPS